MERLIDLSVQRTLLHAFIVACKSFLNESMRVFAGRIP